MASDETPEQVWEQDVDGRRHRVEARGTTKHRVRWLVDDTEVAQKASLEEKLRLEATGVGRLTVVFSTLGAARRATVHGADDDAASSLVGVGGTDLEPAPGSPAARYEQRVREHPTRYAVAQGLGGVGKVVLAIVAGTVGVFLLRLLGGLAPDLPSIPWPDLPSIPFPDLPSIPWPDLPDVQLPGWARWVLDHARYVVPVVVALVLAAGEVRRRRTQDERRRAHEAPREPGDDAS